MTKATKVGLYLGAGSVGATVMQGRNVISLANYEFSSLEESRIENLNDEIRWEALINKVLRDVNADSSNVYVSLSDKDFIFRSLEVPLMKKNEIETSIVFEIEKYIPFKMDELAWAYEYVRLPKEKKNIVSFIGIRQNNLAKTKGILSRLKINALAIEPSCLSLVRAIKTSKRISKINNFAVLDFTNLEASLTFFQYDLPVFNRYLSIPKEGNSINLNKFVESVILSFQYFKREFKAYSLDKFIIISNVTGGELIPPLKEGLQTDIEEISPYDLTSRNNAGIESIKAFGAINRDYYRNFFRPVFKQTELEEKEEVLERPVNIPSLRAGLLLSLLGVGLISSVFLSIFLQNKVSFEKVELQKEERSITVPFEIKKLTWKQRKNVTAKREKEVKILRSLVKSFKGLSKFFDELGQRKILPPGAWLKDLSLTLGKESYKGTMSGYVFRDDDYQERLAIDEFISNLNNEYSAAEVFSSAEINSSAKQSIKGFKVTYFLVRLR